MPTYEYLCQECGERLEVFQKFTDKALKTHPSCGGPLQKVFHASGVVFKGSGYYINDSRSSKSVADSGPAETKSDTKTETKEKKADSKAKDSSKPAPKKPSKSSESAAAAAG